MNIELNKTYLTRSGQKCRIICVDRKNEINAPIIALIDIGSSELLRHLSKDGRFSTILPRDDPYDLISEYIPRPTIDWSALPKWHKYVAMDQDGSWFSYLRKPMHNDRGWMASADGYIRIPPEYAPKWEGDWKQSLICREDKE